MTAKDIVYNILGKDGTAQAWAQARATASRGMDGISSQVATMGGNIAASLGAALSVGALAGLVQQTSSVMGVFKDLQDSFGTTADGMSRLRAGAQLSGAGLEELSDPLGKLVKSLDDADQSGSDSARALSELGLSVKDIKALSPDQQMIKIAEAMQGIKDGSGKAAVATVLFGKSGAALIPILNDIAEVGKDYTAVTQDQIDAADEYAKSTARMQGRLNDFKITVGNGVIPTITDLAKAFTDTDSNGESFAKTMAGGLSTGLRAVAVLGSEVTYVFQQVGKEIGGMAAQVAAVMRGDFKAAFGDGGIGDQMTAEAEKARAAQEKLRKALWNGPEAAKVADAAQPDPAKRKSNFRISESGDKGKAKGKSKETYDDPLSDSAKAWGDAMKAMADQMQAAQIKAMGLGEAQTALFKLMTSPGWDDMPKTWRQTAIAQFEAAHAAEMAAKANETLREAYDRTLTPLREKLADLERETDLYGLTESQISSTIAARIEEAVAIARANGAGEEQIALLEQEASLRRDIASAASRKEVLDANAKAAQESADAWKKAGDDISRSMTDSLYRGFEEGKPLLKSFGDAIGNTLKTTLFRSVVDGLMSPIRNSVSGLMQSASSSIGSSLATLFVASAHGNAFGSSGVMAFANGGVVSGATAFRFAGGNGVMGEAGPEAILPLRRTSSGDLGVIAQGGAAAGLQAVRVELINRTSQPAQAASATPRIDAEGLVVRVVLRDLNNNGPIRQALGA